MDQQGKAVSFDKKRQYFCKYVNHPSTAVCHARILKIIQKRKKRLSKPRVSNWITESIIAVSLFLACSTAIELCPPSLSEQKCPT